MNRQQLQAALRQEKIREDAYDLNGGHLSETYTLGQRENVWVVYYSERGLESGKRDFASEDEACRYLLNLLTRDLTTRM